MPLGSLRLLLLDRHQLPDPNPLCGDLEAGRERFYPGALGQSPPLSAIPALTTESEFASEKILGLCSSSYGSKLIKFDLV